MGGKTKVGWCFTVGFLGLMSVALVPMSLVVYLMLLSLRQSCAFDLNFRLGQDGMSCVFLLMEVSLLFFFLFA